MRRWGGGPDLPEGAAGEEEGVEAGYGGGVEDQHCAGGGGDASEDGDADAEAEARPGTRRRFGARPKSAKARASGREWLVAARIAEVMRRITKR